MAEQPKKTNRRRIIPNPRRVDLLEAGQMAIERLKALLLSDDEFRIRRLLIRDPGIVFPGSTRGYLRLRIDIEVGIPVAPLEPKRKH